MIPVPAILTGIGVGGGASALAWSVTPGPYAAAGPHPAMARLPRQAAWMEQAGRRLASWFGWREAVTASLAAVLIGIITGWPVAALLAGCAAVGLRALFGATSSSVVPQKLEAIASWTEMLRDTLVAASGMTQAIIATAETAPAGVRTEARRLAARLDARVAMKDALAAFADEIGDPTADVIVASLLMASEERAQRLSDLLSALAGSARSEVSMRLRVEASRSSARAAVRTVAIVSIGFMVLLFVAAHQYLAPYGTADGEMVLAVVGVLYGLGLFLMARMARPEVAARLLGDRAGGPDAASGRDAARA